MAFIDDMRSDGHAVESTCRVLREQGCQVAASFTTRRDLTEREAHSGARPVQAG